jgi:hypothetical protein
MRLLRTDIQGFQSYRQQRSIRFDRHLTILAGRNNVGKTALLRALRLLLEGKPGIAPNFRMDCELELEASEIRQAINLPEQAAYGPARHAFESRDIFTLRLVFVSAFDVGALPPTNNDSGLALGGGGMTFFEAEIPEANLAWSLKRFAGVVPPIPRFTWTDDSFIAGLAQPLWITPIQGMWNLISGTFSRLFYIQPRRIGAQSMGFSVTTDLSPDGSNLTTVIATLYNNYRETIFRELEAFICSAFPKSTALT